MKIAVLLAASYLIGSIPFGVIAGRAWRGVDVRRFGSGNIGFSNVLRVLGPGVASVVLAGDVLKGLAPVAVGRLLLRAWGTPEPELWLLAVSLAPILGHSFSVFLGFRGGRAVATVAGTLLGLAWPAALVIARHIPNLGRLLEGTEAKIGQRVEVERDSDSTA